MATKSKKYLSLCAAGIMALSMLTGCGSSNNGPVATPAAKQEDTTPVTLEWLAYQSVAQPSMDSEIVKKVQEKFNVKFNFWYVDDQKWDDVLNIKLASGEIPDIWRLKNKSNLKKYVNQGVVGEISKDTITKYAPNYMKMIDQYDTDKTIWRLTTYDGKNYGFTGVAAGQYPAVIGWRLDWLNNVGITKVPETIDEFQDAFYKFTNNDPDKNGKKDTYGLSNTTIPAIMGAFGAPAFLPTDFKGSPMPNLGWTLNDKSKPVINAIQPEMKEALTLLQKWYKDGVIDPEFLTGENKGGYWALSQDFMNGRIGIQGNASYYHWAPPLSANDQGGNIYVEWKKIKPDIEFGKTYTLGKAPVGPKGKSGQLVGENFAESMVFSSKCVKEDRKVQTILKMLDTLSTDQDYYMTALYGQKGTDYNLNADGSIVSLIKTTQDGFTKGINVFNFMQIVPDISKKLKAPQYEFGDKYKVKGYTAVSIPATDAYSKSYSSLQKLTVETYFKIITGEKSADYFEEFVKTFNANGGNELTKQTQDEWSKLMTK